MSWFGRKSKDSPPENLPMAGTPSRLQQELSQTKPLLINLGCGGRFHPAWINLDVVPAHPSVHPLDLRQPFPIPDSTCDAVYHSHVLEHFSKSGAPLFLRECFRILKPGGIIRIAVPDLEQIARLYLENLNAAAQGDTQAAARHEWLTIELMDQMTRERGGGEMLRYWKQNPMPAEEFVIQRLGNEVQSFLKEYRAAPQPTSPAPSTPPTPAEIAAFRDSGEVHKWMYDRVSLKKLLEQIGFRDIKKCEAAESRIPNFASYHLDVLENGQTRKPDSLFIEGVKP
jgi:predicted SAM-dependent methyltransferase